jgi:hypothetical protein
LSGVGATGPVVGLEPGMVNANLPHDQICHLVKPKIFSPVPSFSFRIAFVLSFIRDRRYLRYIVYCEHGWSCKKHGDCPFNSGNASRFPLQALSSPPASRATNVIYTLILGYVTSLNRTVRDRLLPFSDSVIRFTAGARPGRRRRAGRPRRGNDGTPRIAHFTMLSGAPHV